jgi:hypothetical protein
VLSILDGKWSAALAYADEAVRLCDETGWEGHRLSAMITRARVHAYLGRPEIETDRVFTPGPTPGVDLWWPAKHASHGGNVQVITVPDGGPIWTSDVRPGREHDTTAVRSHAEILPAITEVSADLRSLGDLGYEGEAGTITVALKKTKGSMLTTLQQQFNKARNGIRVIGGRGNALLKMTFKALGNVGLDPWRIGRIARSPWGVLTGTR